MTFSELMIPHSPVQMLWKSARLMLADTNSNQHFKKSLREDILRMRNREKNDYRGTPDIMSL